MFWQLWQWHCRKWGKKNCYEICERVKKKLSRPQYFYNKSHVINYYQFKKICDTLIVVMALPKSRKKIKYNLQAVNSSTIFLF